MSAVYLIEIFLISLLATIISSMSGGGASVIAIPLFSAMNISLALGTAIQKVSAAFWVIPAAKNYLKGRKIDWKFLSYFTLIGLVGSLLGVIFLISITERTFKVLIGAFILIVVSYVYLNKNFGLKRDKNIPRWKRGISYILALPIGFYEGIFGSGNGIIFSLVGVKTRGYDIAESLGYYYAAAFAWVALAAIILISRGFYDWPTMIVAAVGSIIGGYTGSRFARYKGNKFVKMVFCIIGLILGLKLILGF